MKLIWHWSTHKACMQQGSGDAMVSSGIRMSLQEWTSRTLSVSQSQLFRKRLWPSMRQLCSAEASVCREPMDRNIRQHFQGQGIFIFEGVFLAAHHSVCYGLLVAFFLGFCFKRFKISSTLCISMCWRRESELLWRREPWSYHEEHTSYWVHKEAAQNKLKNKELCGLLCLSPRDTSRFSVLTAFPYMSFSVRFHTFPFIGWYPRVLNFF